MCSDVGSKVNTRPSMKKVVELDLDPNGCAGCEMYGWHSMLGTWQTEEGWCKAKMRNGNLSANTPKCDYFLKRREV